MFKVGDRVVGTRLIDDRIFEYQYELPELSMAVISKDGAAVGLNQLRHATPEEIAAVHRIDKSTLMQHLEKCEEVVKTWPKWKLQSVRDAFGIPNLETLRDCDTSPNCKKFDERVK